jgi:DNA-directed RNA polymerase specialized sigma24 family protein
VLRRIHGVPQKEISRELGVSENTVEMHAKRGLKMILRALGGYQRNAESINKAAVALDCFNIASS